MNEIRFRRTEREYEALRSTQTELLESLKQILPAMASAIQENREEIREISRKLDAIIVHLDVPYKPPMGFNTRDNPDS